MAPRGVVVAYPDSGAADVAALLQLLGRRVHHAGLSGISDATGVPGQAGLTRETKVVYVTRNPRDVAADRFRRLRPGHWDAFLEGFLGDQRDAKPEEGLWIDHVLAWNAERDQRPHDVLWLNLEEVIEDRVAVLQGAADFFGVNVTEEDLNGAARDHVNGEYTMPDVGISRTRFTESQGVRMDLLFGVKATEQGLVFGSPGAVQWPVPARGRPKLILGGMVSISSPLDVAVGLGFALVCAYAVFVVLTMEK